MTDLSKYEDGIMKPYGPGAAEGVEVILLHEGEYRGWELGTELNEEIYGKGMEHSKTFDADGNVTGIFSYSEEGIALLVKWCADHSVHFYADDKENFFLHKGVDEAVAAGKKYLLTENLS